MAPVLKRCSRFDHARIRLVARELIGGVQAIEAAKEAGLNTKPARKRIAALEEAAAAKYVCPCVCDSRRV